MENHNGVPDGGGGDSWYISSDEESDIILVPPVPDRRLERSQENEFFDVEKKARLLNGFLTPWERHCLDSSNVPHALRADIKKMLLHFGKGSGVGLACRRLLKHFTSEEPVAVGEAVQLTSVSFTLCKHLVIAERSMNHHLMESYQLIGCSCLAATYTMPEGCIHKAGPLHKQTWLPDTLCKECSRCIRCDKCLVFASCNFTTLCLVWLWLGVLALRQHMAFTVPLFHSRAIGQR